MRGMSGGSAGVVRESLAVPATGQINGHLARREDGVTAEVKEESGSLIHGVGQ